MMPEGWGGESEGGIDCGRDVLEWRKERGKRGKETKERELEKVERRKRKERMIEKRMKRSIFNPPGEED